MSPVTLPAPTFYTALSLLDLSDEDDILQRLFDRDEALLTALTEIQATREDLFVQFGRVSNLESLLDGLSRQIDAIIAAFFLDIDENGVVADNYAFFQRLIQDLVKGLEDLDRLTAQIIRFEEIKALLIPIRGRLGQLEDLDTLIGTKLDYLYGKWDVNPNDDIFSV